MCYLTISCHYLILIILIFSRFLEHRPLLFKLYSVSLFRLAILWLLLLITFLLKWKVDIFLNFSIVLIHYIVYINWFLAKHMHTGSELARAAHQFSQVLDALLGSF